jgi:hypothetical protein
MPSPIAAAAVILASCPAPIMPTTGGLLAASAAGLLADSAGDVLTAVLTCAERSS